MTALTWALEICDPQRFRSIADAVSYCGLTSALDSSADKQHRGPISKQRNGHLQTVLIEAAKLAPRWNPQFGRGARPITGAGKPQPSHLGGGTQAGCVFTGGRQIRPALPHPHTGGANRGVTTHSELTSGKGGFPTATARRLVRGSGTVLAVKGSLRRAKIRRALDDCGPFHPIHSCDGRLRRENQNTPLGEHHCHLLAIHRPFLAVLRLPQGENSSSWATLVVSRPAGLLQFNLRGRLRAVPANGCLVPQQRGPNRQRVGKRKS